MIDAIDPARGWQGDQLDLDAYLRRIGFDGDRSPTLATLRALHRAHVTSIPFENLEIMLDRPLPLGVAHIQDKLVRRRRGGYCFEHTELFAAALERLGFRFTGLIGRVVMGTDKLRPASHALLLVKTAEPAPDGEAWLCDVGFGRGPLAPIELVDGAEVDQDGWGYRLERLTAAAEGLAGVQEWALHQRGAEGWLRRHTFLLAPAYGIDYAVANHYVSTSPRSPFTGRVYAQRFSPKQHHELDETRLTITPVSGPSEAREVAAEEVPQILAEVFDIVVADIDARRLVAGIKRRQAATGA